MLHVLDERTHHCLLFLCPGGGPGMQVIENDDGGPPTYKCVQCSRTYKYKDNLLSHQRYECGQQPQFPCSQCPYKAKRKAHLKAHLRCVDQRFGCDRCGRSYKHKTHLLTHQRYECGEAPQFPCPRCPYRAKRKSHLKAHLACKHLDTESMIFLKLKSVGCCSSVLSVIHRYAFSNTGDPDKRFVCGDCGRNYKRKDHLVRHQRYECGKEPQFPCKYCEYRAKRASHLQRHMVNRHVGYMLCDDCGRVYKYKGTLTFHKRYECGKDPQFQCFVCPFRSKRRSNLHAHIACRHAKMYMSSRHCGGDYACDGCDRTYKRLDSLTRHKRNECGKEPRYHCLACSYKTKHNFNLRAHMALKHSQII
ncbi:hypothetical protein J6590_014827 [Homalodisca vitripennis]|nr:hypothetical protein J6590_014827 [Homalodisca vitripennis]